MSHLTQECLRSVLEVHKWLSEAGELCLPSSRLCVSIQATADAADSEAVVAIVVLCGSAVLYNIRVAVHHSRAHHPPLPILVTGGVGHSTRYLLEALVLNEYFQCRVKSGITLPSHVAMEAKEWMPVHAPAAVALFCYCRLTGGVGSAGAFADGTQIDEEKLLAACVALQRSESDWISDMLDVCFGVSPEMVWQESKSTNCGENALFVCRMLCDAVKEEKETTSAECSRCSNYVQARLSYPVRMSSRTKVNYRLLIVQDPTMQRRTILSFKKHAQDIQMSSSTDNTDVSFTCYSDATHWLTEQLAVVSTAPELDSVMVEWCGYPFSRYASLVAGERDRLSDSPNGYGPRGKGFIGETSVPELLEAHFARICSETLIRGRQV